MFLDYLAICCCSGEMFARWNLSQVKRRANLKTALVSKVKDAAIKSMPRFDEIVDEIFPKKTPVIIHHLGDHITMYSIEGRPLLVQLGDGTVFPHLKLPIEYPGLLQSVYCFDEAVMALLRGADLMARGTWGIDETFQVGDVVQVCLMNEESPFAVGILMMTPTDIKNRIDGAAVHILHTLKDGLWEVKSV